MDCYIDAGNCKDGFRNMIKLNDACQSLAGRKMIA
jgi:hypothetical protein